MKIRSWAAVFLYLSLALVVGCPKSEAPEQAELPLVLSLPGRYREWSSILGFTDSLLYVATFVGVDSINWGVMLRRYPLANPRSCDTLVLNIPGGEPPYRAFGNTYEVYSLDLNINASYRLSNQLHPGWILFPLPLGDTSRMVHVGNVEMINVSGTLPEFQFNNMLADRMELFYVVDVHSSKPRTVAAVQGFILRVEQPYLLLFTGYGYNILEKGIVSFGRINLSSNEILAVDLRDMRVVARIPAPELEDLNLSLRVRITADCRLLYEEIDSIAEFTASYCYIVEQDRVVSSGEFQYIFYKRFRILLFLNRLTRFTEIKFLYELAKHKLIPLRSYQIESRQVLVHDLELDDSTYAELLIPTNVYDDAYDPSTESFLSPSGKALFISPRRGWGFPDLDLPENYVQLPAVSDLQSPPREISELRRFKKPGWEMDWELSPDKRWLVLRNHKRFLRLRMWLSKRLPPFDHILIPTEVLSDPSLLKSKKSCVNIPQYQSAAPFRFVPGDEWVLVYEDVDWAPGDEVRDRPSPRLRSCDGSVEAITLMSSNEHWLKHVFFSPDGRYAGYVCCVKGENYYRLQVRRLPP
ncbi:hypothetical protein CEE36_09505 [candidate division TA06 bacterium B3_TA06]|uniref:Uncharacterized protein n=1 Tax=candidate division TA06 bacterium B3_TA06 TaxID=2012487 RepID=A0A532UZY0_UNCT6|nr:MAG: hypothetical protein CEE36_09505 [candidate division TA06 bacterium B3_TA06]